MITVVTPANPLTLVSLQEAKGWLKVDYTEDDEIITMLIKSAYRWAEKFTNSSILERTLKYYSSEWTFRLPFSPVKEIVGVNLVSKDGSEEYTRYSTYDNLFYSNWHCDKLSHGSRYEVTYEAGLPVGEVEEAYKEAILKLVHSSYEIRGNEVTGTEGIAISTVKITREAKDILRPYIRYI